MLDNELVMPLYVLMEICDENTHTNVSELLAENKLKLLKENSLEEIQKFMEGRNKLGNGEKDVMLTYQKLNDYQNNIHCVLDDQDARKAATKLGIKCIGLLGLLQQLKDKGIISHVKVDEIFMLLKRHGFRVPDNFKIK